MGVKMERSWSQFVRPMALDAEVLAASELADTARDEVRMTATRLQPAGCTGGGVRYGL